MPLTLQPEPAGKGDAQKRRAMSLPFGGDTSCVKSGCFMRRNDHYSNHVHQVGARLQTWFGKAPVTVRQPPLSPPGYHSLPSPTSHLVEPGTLSGRPAAESSLAMCAHWAAHIALDERRTAATTCLSIYSMILRSLHCADVASAPLRARPSPSEVVCPLPRARRSRTPFSSVGHARSFVSSRSTL